MTTLFESTTVDDVVSTPTATKDEPVKPIPSKDDPEAKRYKKKKIAEKKNTGGKQSTILTSQDKLY